MPIGLDLGSSSTKALLVGRRGDLLATVRRRFATRRGRGSRVEQDAEAILSASLAALLSAARSPLSSETERFGIATQRSTVLFWDRDSGRPLTPAYSWQDLRGAALCHRLPDALVASRTGLRLSPHYSASKVAWALSNVRGLRRKVAAGRALWGTLGTFLVWRLSGGSLYAIDHANAQRTLLFDIALLSWDVDLFRLFGLEALLDAPALPALVPVCLSPEINLKTGGRSLRLAAMTGDQQAALLGLGCRRPDDLAINYGSGAFVLRNSGERPERVPGLLTTLLASWRASDGRGAVRGRTLGFPYAAHYAVEGPVNAAATAIDWVQRHLGLRVRTADLDRFLGPDDRRPRGAHFLPAVSGLGAPRWDPGARPLFAGDLRRASARELMRAVVESIAFRCAEIVRAASAPRPGGRSLPGEEPVLVAGGLTACRTLLQAQADLLQRPLLVRESPDATGLGAALLARRAPADLFPRAADRSARRSARAAARRGRLVRPRISSEEAEERYRLWERAVYGRGAERSGAGRSGVGSGEGPPR
jgi:glycerol kinase